jgi:hypothetical protein
MWKILPRYLKLHKELVVIIQFFLSQRSNMAIIYVSLIIIDIIIRFEVNIFKLNMFYIFL